MLLRTSKEYEIWYKKAFNFSKERSLFCEIKKTYNLLSKVSILKREWWRPVVVVFFMQNRIYIVQDDFKIQNSMLSRIVDLSVKTDFMSQNVSWTIYTAMFATRLNNNYVSLTWSGYVPFHGWCCLDLEINWWFFLWSHCASYIFETYMHMYM